MRIPRFTGSLRFLFISYAFGSAFLPLAIIAAVFFVFVVSIFNEDLDGRIRKSVSAFNMTLQTVERGLKDRALVFTSLVASQASQGRQDLADLLVRIPLPSGYQVVELCVGDEPVARRMAAGIPAGYGSTDLYTPRERLRAYWEQLQPDLVSYDDTVVEKVFSDKLFLLRCAAPIYDRNLRKLGIAVFSSMIDDKTYASIKSLSGTEAMVYYRGRPIGSSLFEGSDARRTAAIPEYDELLAELRAEPIVIRDKLLVDNRYQVGFFPIHEKRAVIAIGAVALDKIRFQSSVRAVTLFLALSLLASFAIILVLGYWASNRVMRPVLELVAAAEMMSTGKLDVRVSHLPSNELGRLTEAFNVMAVALGTQQNFLDEWNATLQEKVDARTKDLRTAQAAIIHAEKMASLGQLTAGIAHEIKNPLNYIINFSENNIDFTERVDALFQSLQGQLDPADVLKVRKLLFFLTTNCRDIREESQKIASIIHGMLNQAREDTNVKEPMQVNGLLRDGANLVYHSMRATNPGLEIDFAFELAEGLPPLSLNSTQISRALINVLDNAVYATIEKKSRQPEGYRPAIRIRSLAVPGGVRIEIEDNGNGIPDEIRDKIFDPFFTTKPPTKGTGLGLKFVYDIVIDGHGGTIDVETATGMYTRLIITLPADAAPAADPEAERSAP